MITPKSIIVLLFISSFILIMACQKLLPPAPKSEDIIAEPIEGLTPEQLAVHLVGDVAFEKVFSKSEGLGSIFVAASCASCHSGDGKGHPSTTLTRFGKYNGSVWDAMSDKGGPQLQERAVAGYKGELIPTEATGVTRIIAPAVTGLGFLEAVDDVTILALADSSDANADGISGIPNYINPPSFFVPKPNHISTNGLYIGRFGKKAAAIDLLQQVAGAYINDMGITSDINMQDLFNPQAGQFTEDEVADPEVPASIVRSVVFYIQTLKVPPRRNNSDIDVLAGEKLFSQIGCEKCHVSTLKTGKSNIVALSEKEFHPYTDLLLHDMGNELDDGYTEGTAKTSEWKTPPLWGIGLAKDSQGGLAFFLHDGRAKSLEQAIEFHGGEGAASRTAFRNLSENEKQQLIKFLESL